MIDNITEQQKNIDLILQQAIALHTAGQVAEAEQLYRRILETYPNHAGAHHNLGLIAAQTGHHAPSLQHFKIALEGAPDHIPTILWYANAQMHNGYLLDAMKTIKAARQRGIDDPELKAAQRKIDEAIAYSISNPSPTPEEWEPLYKLAREKNWADLEKKTHKLTEKYAKAGGLWKMLTMSLEAQGKPALATKRKAAQLLPGDMELQANLANQLAVEGQAAEAEQILNNAVSNNPGNAQAHCNLGIYLDNTGRALQAAVSVKKALELDPNLIAAHCAMAMLLQKSGQTNEARASCQRALQVQTNSADLLGMLGLTLFELGDFEEAARQFNRALEINPLHVEALINLGNTLRLFGLNDDAKKCYYRALEIEPRASLAHNNLGLMLFNDGEYKNAITSFQRAIALSPNYVNAYNNLGGVLLQVGLFVDAGHAYQKSLSLVPNSVVALCGLGAAFQSAGQFNEALQCYQNVQKIDPKFAINYRNLSGILCQSGRLAEAEDAINQGLSLDPADPRLLVAALALIPYKADDARFERLDHAYSRRNELGLSDRISLCLAFGRAMETAGQFEQAFLAYQEGNQASYQIAPFNEAACRAQVQLICDGMTAEKFAALHTAAQSLPTVEDHRVPVFIVGMPRSGSTLLEQVLDSHPAVRGAGELGLIGNLLAQHAQKLAQVESDPVATVLTLREMGTAYLDAVWKLAPKARVITDKMLTNFFYLGHIKLMLPQARFIHAVRNPLDTCFSAYAIRFNGAHEYTYDLEVLGRFYLDYQRLMRHWGAVLPAGSVLDVEYEKVVMDLEQQARRILDFIGLSWDEACLKFYDSQRVVTSPSSVQVRRPIYSSSVGRAKAFEQYLEPLVRILGN